MERLWLFSAGAGLLLSSATPPPAASEQPVPDCVHGGPCAEPIETAAEAPVASAHVPPARLAAAAPVAAPPPVSVPVAAEPPVETPEPSHPAPPPEPPTPASNVRIVVSIPQQRAYVFEDGELLATSPVSTGKRGHATPAGTFPILQKKVHHRSNKYANAPMPYMQRLTWGGVALHAGSVPGYPASHGCIRLPRKFAKKLYNLTDHGTVVTVTNKRLKSSKEARALT